jgi:Type II secretion system (T2SS), protein G
MKLPLPRECRVVVNYLWLLGSTILLGCCGRISPESETYTSVTLLRNAINEFVAAHGRAPVDLQELARSNPSVTTWKDGWGNPLIYRIDNSDVASLSSLGGDNRPGGAGQDADLVWTFSLKDSAGKWRGTNLNNGGFDDWLANPFRPIR